MLRRRSLATIALGVSAAVIAVISLRHPLREQWHLYRLNSDDQEIRKNAVASLGGIRSVRAIPRFISLWRQDLHDTPFAGSIRELTCEALAEIGPAAIPSLVDALEDTSEGVRTCAAIALTRIKPEGVDVLIQQLENHKPYVRSYAAWALSGVGAEASPAVSTLAKLLGDKDPEVRKYSAAALREIGQKAEPAVPALIAALSDEHPPVRVIAETTLTRIGPPAVSALIGKLRDEDEVVRRAAVNALGKMGADARSAVPALRERLKDESDQVRWRAEWAVNEILKQ